MPGIILPDRWTRQPQHAVEIDWSNPLTRDLEYVLLGSVRQYNPTNRNITRVRTNADVPTQSGIGASIQETEYETYPLPVATGGTTNWTIAGLFMPVALSTSTANADGNAVVGYCEAPGTSAAWDRMIYLQNTTQAWRAYLFDGAQKLATSPATAQVGKLDKVIATTNGSTLVCAVDGVADASVAVSTNGYNGYSSAEFCVGNPINAGGILQTAIPLLVKANRFWPADLRRSFFDDPWQIFKPQRRKIFFDLGAGGGPSTYNVSQTDSASLADSQSSAAVVSGSVSDALALADQTTSGSLIDVAVSEPTSLSDTCSGQATLQASASESIAPSDAVASAVAFGVAASESAALSDAATAQASVVASQSDAFALADTTDANVNGGATVYNVSVSEGLALADTPAASCVFPAALIEPAALADAVAATGVFPVVAAEAVSLAETQAAPQAGSGAGATAAEIWAYEIAPGLSAGQALLDLWQAKHTPADVADAVLAAAQATPIHADVQKMNGAQVLGNGTSVDKWRGA